MVTTLEIIDKAQELGKLLGQHEAVTQLESVLKSFQEDVESQRSFNDYQHQIAKIGQKEAEGQPIEVEEKRKLADLQNDVIQNPILREMQVKQMDYLDLMRQVDEAITSQSSIAGLASAAGSADGSVAAG